MAQWLDDVSWEFTNISVFFLADFDTPWLLQFSVAVSIFVFFECKMPEVAYCSYPFAVR